MTVYCYVLISMDMHAVNLCVRDTWQAASLLAGRPPRLYYVFRCLGM